MNYLENQTEKQERQRVLVVDSDLDMLKLLNRTLELEGLDTVVVIDQDSAVGILEKLDPDLVIFDTVVPDEEVLNTIEKMRKRSNVPIVVLASDSETATLKATLSHGADDFIRKPFSAKVFIARIKAKLRRYHQKVNALHPLPRSHL